MDRTRTIFVVIILLTVCIIGGVVGYQYFSDFLTESSTDSETDEPAIEVPDNAVLVTMASSNTKRGWLDQITADFNAAEVKTSNGRLIVVDVSHVTSGGSMNSILEGSLQPVIWSPGDQSWV
ncbi:MAG: solute-binding protein, partial [Chloroflexi bacterium]|nr:solute-binding protein [Chloroflexota bacterium]